MTNIAGRPILDRYRDLAASYISPSSGIPALSFVVSVLLVCLYIFSIFDPEIDDSWSLNSDSVFHPTQFYRFNTYPLVHAGFAHIFFNIIALWAPLCEFERQNGTVHTALVLSILSVSVAIPFCLISSMFFPDVSVLGASGWVFSFVAYFSYTNSLEHRTIRLFDSFEVPTLSVPFIMLIFVFLMVPNSSLLGHFLGICAGFVLAKGWFVPLTVPPGNIVGKIEEKLSSLIAIIPSCFLYTKEDSVKGSRYSYESTSLPLYTDSTPNRAQQPKVTRQDEGQVLGTNL